MSEKTNIAIKARIEPRDPRTLAVVIRKTVVDDRDGRVIGKYGLSHLAEWIEVPENTRYPDNCVFMLTDFDLLEQPCRHGRNPTTCWECGQDCLEANYDKGTANG